MIERAEPRKGTLCVLYCIQTHFPPILFCGWGSPPLGHLRQRAEPSCHGFSLHPASLEVSVLACALDSANQIQMPKTLHGEQQIQRAEKWRIHSGGTAMTREHWLLEDHGGRGIIKVQCPQIHGAMVAMLSSFGKNMISGE